MSKCQKSPIIRAKEAYCKGKRDLLGDTPEVHLGPCQKERERERSFIDTQEVTEGRRERERDRER